MERRLVLWNDPRFPGIMGVRIALTGTTPEERAMLGSIIQSIEQGSIRVSKPRTKTICVRERLRIGDRGGKKVPIMKKIVTRVSLAYRHRGRVATLAIRRPPKERADERLVFDSVLVALIRTKGKIVIHPNPTGYDARAGIATRLVLTLTPPLPE